MALRSLNVLIGPNGSGKSNFLDAFDVLRAAPDEITLPLQRGGRIDAWLWQTERGAPADSFTIEAVVRVGSTSVRYTVSLASRPPFGFVSNERIEEAKAKVAGKKPYFYFGYENGRPMINGKGEKGGDVPNLVEIEVAVPLVPIERSGCVEKGPANEEYSQKEG